VPDGIGIARNQVGGDASDLLQPSLPLILLVNECPCSHTIGLPTAAWFVLGPMANISPCGQMSQCTQDSKKHSQPLHTPRIFYDEGPALMAARLSVDYATPSVSRLFPTQSHIQPSRTLCDYPPPLLASCSYYCCLPREIYISSGKPRNG
jgi:hypothetical protein